MTKYIESKLWNSEENYLKWYNQYDWKGWITFYREAMRTGRKTQHVINEAMANGWVFDQGAWRKEK